MVVDFRYAEGKAVAQLAITVDPDVHAKVMEAAAEDGVSVSAWMTAAARRELLVRDGLAAVAEWEAEHGAFSEADLLRLGHGSLWSSLPRRLVPVVVRHERGVRRRGAVAAGRSNRQVWADLEPDLKLV